MQANPRLLYARVHILAPNQNLVKHSHLNAPRSPGLLEGQLPMFQKIKKCKLQSEGSGTHAKVVVIPQLPASLLGRDTERKTASQHPSQLRLVGVYTLLSLTASALYFLNGGRCACPGLLQSGKRLRHLFRLLGIRFHHFSAHARVVSLRAANRLLRRGHQHNAKNPSAQPHCIRSRGAIRVRDQVRPKLKGSPNKQTARKT